VKFLLFSHHHSRIVKHKFIIPFFLDHRKSRKRRWHVRLSLPFTCGILGSFLLFFICSVFDVHIIYYQFWNVCWMYFYYIIKMDKHWRYHEIVQKKGYIMERNMFAARCKIRNVLYKMIVKNTDIWNPKRIVNQYKWD
jgi:hypothetical protein